MHSYSRKGTYRHREAYIPLAPSCSHCVVMNGVSPVYVARGPCGLPLGAWGRLVAFLPGFLSPDSAPAVHAQVWEKEHAKGKNNSSGVQGVVRPCGGQIFYLTRSQATRLPCRTRICYRGAFEYFVMSCSKKSPISVKKMFVAVYSRPSGCGCLFKKKITAENVSRTVTLI